MSKLKTEATQNAEQLRLDLQLDDDVLADAEARGIPVEEALLVSNAARQALDDGSAEDPQHPSAPWIEDYRELREAGWPWRVACYIAWAASPVLNRWPKNQRELARDVLGLRSDRVIRTWRAKNPAIEAAVGMLQAKALFKHRRDVLNALIASASTPNHKNAPDRKLFFEMTGDYTPRAEITTNEAPRYTSDELAKAAAKAQALEEELEP